MITGEPRLVPGERFEDARGFLWPVELEAPAVRFYISRNRRQGAIRAWHGHPKEWRIVRCIHGAAKVALLKLDDHKDARIYTLYEDILTMPAGWALGWQSLTLDTKVLFLAPAHYADRDDIRLDPDIRADIWVNDDGIISGRRYLKYAGTDPTGYGAE